MKPKRALVLGGGLAGMLAAKVLADYFEEVMVVERDSYPQAYVSRAGVPQSEQLHGLMVAGLQLLQRPYPELVSALTAAGAVMSDSVNETILYYSAQVGYVRRYPSALLMPTCSRPLLEGVLRQLTLAGRAIQVQKGVVKGLLWRDNRVVGAKVWQKGVGVQAVTADLVIDTTGRQSRVVTWLAEEGIEAPKETVIDVGVTYAARSYAEPAGFTADWRTLLVNSERGKPRLGSLRRIEGGRWQVMLVGIQGEKVPHDDAGFLAFAQTLATPLIYETLCLAQPVSPVYGFGTTFSRRRDWAGVANWPGGLLVMGDAFWCYNPIYGLGMTSLATAGDVLADMLVAGEMVWSGADGVVFHQRLAGRLERFWRFVAGAEVMWQDPAVVGWRARWLQRGVQAVLPAVLTDSVLLPQAMMVRQQLLPFTALLRPRLAIALMRYWLKGTG